MHTLSARGSGGQLDEFLQKVFGVDRFWHGRVHALCQALLDLFQVFIKLRERNNLKDCSHFQREGPENHLSCTPPSWQRLDSSL